MRLKFNICFLFGAAIFIIGCQQKEEHSETHAKVNQRIDTIPFDSLQTDLASFIAGVPFEGDTSLKRARSRADWKSFSSKLDTSWKSLINRRLKPMKNWSEKEMKDINSSDRPLFYPFSGPDFLNASTLFPKCKTYTLVGLEPVGDIPDVRKMDQETMTNYLHSIDNSLDDIFKRSYFISKHMLEDLQQNKVNGTLPLLEIFLIRTGNKIRNIELISLGDSGNIVSRINEKAQSKMNRGVKIEFLNSANEIKTLFYFKVDLEDRGLSANPAFIKYTKNLGEINTYLKSASYLLHYKFFSLIRNLILGQSQFVLQDDSGIAYRFFEKKDWDIKLYGQYSEPITDFKGVTQDDLQYEYNKHAKEIEPLSFVLGYHWESRGINLMKASRIHKP